MSWFFDKDDPFALSLKDFCEKLSKDVPKDASLSRIPWNKGKTGLQTAWNKGKKIGNRSQQTKDKLSKSLSGRTLSEEHRRKIGEANAISKLGSIPWNKGKSKHN